MKFSIGGSFGEPVQELETDRVKCFAEDGRQMFEIVLRKDGRSIEIRGISTCKVADILYYEQLVVEPNCSNMITVSTKLYNA